MWTRIFLWESLSGKILFVIAGLNLFLMMGLTAADVLGRYLFHSPIKGAHELIELMMGLSVFAVLPILSARSDQISIGLLDSRFRGRVAKWKHLAVNAISLVFLVLISWRVWHEMIRSFAHGDATAYLRIPHAPIIAVMTVLVALAVMATLAHMVDVARNLRPICTNRSDEL